MTKQLSHSFKSANRDVNGPRRAAGLRYDHRREHVYDDDYEDDEIHRGDEEDEGEQTAPEGPLAALTRRLKRSGSRSEPKAKPRRGRDSSEPPRQRGETVVDPDEIAETAAALVTRRVAASERHTARALDNLAQMIEDSHQRRAEASERKTARALENIAEMIEAGAKSSTQDEFDALADRLGRLETKLAQPSSADDARPIRAALARLESRIDRLSKDDRANEFAQALSGLDQRLSQIAARLDDDARGKAASPPPAPAGPRPRPYEEREALASTDVKAERAAPRPLAEAIADITRRQQALDETYAPQRAPHRADGGAVHETARTRRRFDDLRASMHALSRRLDARGAQDDGTWDSEADTFAGHLESLRRQISDLARTGHPDLTQRVEDLRAAVEAQARQTENLRADLMQHPDQQLLIMRQIETLRRETEELARAQQSALERRIDELRASHEELARRIDSLRGDAARRPEQQFLFMREIEALQRKVDEAASVEPPRIARRFDELNHALGELARQLAEARAESEQNARQQGLVLRQMEALRQEVEGLSRLVGDIAPRASVAAIETALCDLSHRIDAQRDRGVADQALAPAERVASELWAAIKDLDPAPKLRYLQADVAAIRRRLDEAKTSGAADTAALSALARQTSEINESLRLLASRPFPVETIETRLVELSQRVEALSLNATPGASADLGEVITSIHTIVSAETSKSFAFNQRLERLAGKLDEALANSGAKRFDELTARIGEMHDSLAQRIERGAAAQKPATAAALENLLAALAKKIDGALDAKTHNPAFEELGRKIEALEDRFRDPGAGSARIQRIPARPENEAQFTQLTQRLEDLAGTLSARFEQGDLAKGGVEIAQFEELARKLGDRIDAALAPGANRRDLEHLEQQIEHLSVKLDRIADAPRAAHGEEPAAPSAPQAQLNDLSRRIDVMHEALAARIDEGARLRAQASENQLAGLVEGLARKIDAALAPSADSGAVAALEEQIKELSARLDHSGGAVPALALIEGRIAELFARLEATSEEATEAAEAALRKATLEVLREANGTAARLNPAFKQELDELRRTQDESGARTHETLSVVHETLERVVDRLAAFEEELTELRVTSPAQEREQESARWSGAAREPAKPAQAASAIKLRAEPQFAAAPLGRRGQTVEDFDLGELEAAETTPTDFIAAARRAAQQAAAEADAAQAQQEARRMAARSTAGPAQRTASKSADAPADADANMRKRPILLGLATLLVIGAVGGLYGAARFGLLSAGGAPPAAQSDASRKAPARADGDQGRQKSAAPAAPAQPTLAPQQSAPTGASEAAPPTGKAAAGAQSDDTPTGSIDRPVALADETAAIKQAATRGDAAAQYQYAARLSEGRGVARDAKAAALWFEKAAAQGLVPAQYRLGSMYEKGVGVDRDYAKARSWYQLAGDGGNARAMHNLAVMFAEGNEGKPDYGVASDWFRKAAELGVRDSQYNLAILYARGLGVGQSLVQSYMWFAAAAAQGDLDAAKKRDDIGGRLDSKELAKARELAESFKPRQPKREANEVVSPKGGWEGLKAQTLKPDAKPFFAPSPTGRPKVSEM